MTNFIAYRKRLKLMLIGGKSENDCLSCKYICSKINYPISGVVPYQTIYIIATEIAGNYLFP